MMSLGRRGRDFFEEPEMTKQPVLNKKTIDDMTDFHGFITPGGKCSNQRLEDECSTALPSQCTTGSLESLPTTPAGFGTLLPAPVSALGQDSMYSWQPGVQTWRPGNQLDELESFSKELRDALQTGPLEPSVSKHSEPEFPDVFKHSEPEFPDVFTAIEPSAAELASPPSTPRQERTAPRTCPPAPDMFHPMPTLMDALKRNDLDLVSEALESEPESARLPFWDHNAEPPLCAAMRLGCSLNIVDLLLKSGADVKAQNFACENPLDVLKATTWRAVASSAEIEELLLSAGAQLSNNAQEEGTMNLVRWDAFACAGTLNDFGLPPGSDYDFDNLFEGIPPPPPPR